MADADVIIVGGGHNGLAAAAYLARAGVDVVVLEGRDRTGGAVASERPFAGVDAKLSSFSYLVSVLPTQIVDELGLRIDLASRSVASYTPYGDRSAILVERPEAAATAASFRARTGSDQAYEAWQQLHHDLGRFATVVAPTLTAPLPAADDLAARLPGDLWAAVVHRPIGQLIKERLGDDVLAGIVGTDALIGTFARLDDPSLVQNRCLLYHVIGNGTGEWKVPVGGMGTIANALLDAAIAAGATIRTGAHVDRVEPDADGVTVRLADGSRLRASTLLVGCAPAVLDRLLGREPTRSVEGSQLKINMVLDRLPRLRSGLDPQTAFAGTVHVAQAASQLETAYQQAAAGSIPDPMPLEVYCHSLTDASILGPELQARAAHTLTLFGLHTPARLFRADPDRARTAATEIALRTLQTVLAEPLADCLARDTFGEPCVQTITPVDLETELGLPGGHIFHGDLQWPWLPPGSAPTSAAERWGVATDHPRILLCGSGAVRGGAVSALGGHNAAHALLEAS